MEAEPWEALDLDDSDLPSLLRPCKRGRSTTLPTTSAAVNPPSQPASPPKENRCEELQLQLQPLPSSSCHHRAIPGPAGAVKAAMLRKDIDRQNQSLSEHHDLSIEGFDGNYGVISTQDYIRRAVEDSGEFDDDFARDPWISALHSLGDENGLIPSTPISSIKKCINGDRVAQVVAVIKSCTPNGLGGLMVLLKDPTGTVGASIHQKDVYQSEFGKNLTIGTVLILKEVAVFSPVRSAYYLNITKRNLVKVFCQDSGSTSKLYDSACPVEYADPGKTKGVEKMQNVASEDSQNHTLIWRQNLLTGSTRSNSAQARREHINLSQQACSQTMIRAENQLEFDNGGGNLEGSNINTANCLTKHGGEDDIQGSCQGEIQRQQKASLPQWTDEQLDQLFADDDDASVF